MQTSQDAGTTKKTTQFKRDETYAFEGHRPTALQENNIIHINQHPSETVYSGISTVVGKL